jgi:hypothetical protein
MVYRILAVFGGKLLRHIRLTNFVFSLSVLFLDRLLSPVWHPI